MMDDKSVPLHAKLREAIDDLVAAETNYAQWNSLDNAKTAVRAQNRVKNLLDRVAIEFDGVELQVGKDGSVTYG